MSIADLSVSTDDSILKTRALITVEWKIKNFFNLLNKENYKLDSPYFMFSGIEWYLRIRPNGDTDTQSVGYISLYLYKRCTPSAVCAPYRIEIRKAEGSVLEAHDGKGLFPKEEHGLGLHRFFLKSELLKLRDVVAPADVLTIFCTIKAEDTSVGAVELEDSSEILPTDGLDEMLSRNFKELYLSGCEGDIKVIVKGKEFTSHKAILAARCPVFRSMLELDMAEKSSGSVNIVDCDPDCFNDFLLFLYSGELNIVTPDNASGLYFIADKYDVKQLKEACCACMSREISVESVCDIVHLATLHNEPELLDTATEFFINNANRIVTTPKWISFLAEHHLLANELLIKMTNKYIK